MSSFLNSALSFGKGLALKVYTPPKTEKEIFQEFLAKGIPDGKLSPEKEVYIRELIQKTYKAILEYEQDCEIYQNSKHLQVARATFLRQVFTASAEGTIIDAEKISNFVHAQIVFVPELITIEFLNDDQKKNVIDELPNTLIQRMKQEDRQMKRSERKLKRLKDKVDSFLVRGRQLGLEAGFLETYEGYFGIDKLTFSKANGTISVFEPIEQGQEESKEDAELLRRVEALGKQVQDNKGPKKFDVKQHLLKQLQAKMHDPKECIALLKKWSRFDLPDEIESMLLELRLALLEGHDQFNKLLSVNLAGYEKDLALQVEEEDLARRLEALVAGLSQEKEDQDLARRLEALVVEPAQEEEREDPRDILHRLQFALLDGEKEFFHQLNSVKF